MSKTLKLLKGHLRLRSRYEEDGKNTIYARYCECGAKFTNDISVFLHHYELIKEDK